MQGLAIVLVAYGTYLRIGFQTGDECEMTYSKRIFVPIDMSSPLSSSLSSSSSSSAGVTPETTKTQQKELFRPTYGLYKFIDARDPRNFRIAHQDGRSVQDHCTSTNQTNVGVLYVPGHWGSFEQCRSIGAHGLQITRRNEGYAREKQQHLYNGYWHNGADTLDRFVFDVYCLDFDGQGSGLHGLFLERQAEFLRKTVEHLVVSN